MTDNTNDTDSDRTNQETKIYEKGSFGWLKEQTKKTEFNNNMCQQEKIKRYQNCINQIKNIDQIEKILTENKIDIKDYIAFCNFWLKVDIKDNVKDCWNWVAGSNNNGYGKIRVGYDTILAHRLAYMLTKGDIPEELQVQHLCNIRLCCNPNHLKIGTQSENLQYAVKCNRQGSQILTDDQVREIHILYNEQLKLHPELQQFQITEHITKKFGIAKSTIDKILNGTLRNNIWKEFHDVIQYKVKCCKFNSAKGENNSQSKFTDDQVREIHISYNEQRKLYPGLKQWQITEPIIKKYGVTKSTIDQILNGIRWYHIYKEFH
jgi:hypothetical protein